MSSRATGFEAAEYPFACRWTNTVAAASKRIGHGPSIMPSLVQHANNRYVTGLDLVDATDGMLLLDRYRDGRRDDQLGAMFCVRFAPLTTKGSRR
jgi:hypothetical protein